MINSNMDVWWMFDDIVLWMRYWWMREKTTPNISELGPENSNNQK